MGPGPAARRGVPGRESRDRPRPGAWQAGPRPRTKQGRKRQSRAVSPARPGTESGSAERPESSGNLPATAPGGEETPAKGRVAQRVPSLNESRPDNGRRALSPSRHPRHIHTSTHSRGIPRKARGPRPRSALRRCPPHRGRPQGRPSRRPLRGQGPRWDSRASHSAGPRGSPPSAAKATRALPSEPGELRREWIGAQASLTPSPSLPPTVDPSAPSHGRRRLPEPGGRESTPRRGAWSDRDWPKRPRALAAGLRKPTDSLAEASHLAEPRRLMGNRNSLPKLCGTQRAARSPQVSSARLGPGLGVRLSPLPTDDRLALPLPALLSDL